MRILKYLFLLLLLALFASTVYVSTLKGDFDVKTTMIIKSPKATLFNYINDYRNWETFVSWKKEDPKAQFYYPKNTVGHGGSYSWKSADGDGGMKTTALKENEFIRQPFEHFAYLASMTGCGFGIELLDEGGVVFDE